MNKTTAMVLLVVFGNLLIIALGTAQIFLWVAIRPTMLSLAAVKAVYIIGRYARRGVKCVCLYNDKRAYAFWNHRVFAVVDRFYTV